MGKTLRRSIPFALTACLLAAPVALAYPVSEAHVRFLKQKSSTSTVVQSADFHSTVRKVDNHQAAITFTVTDLRASGDTTLRWESIGYVDTASASRIGVLVNHRIQVHNGSNHGTFRITLTAHDSQNVREALCSVAIWIFDDKSNYRIALLASNGLDPHNAKC